MYIHKTQIQLNAVIFTLFC